MIRGTKEAVRKVRKLIDEESNLPDSNHPYPCTCGAFEITIYDDDNDKVQCTKCGKIRHAGGATLRVYREQKSETLNVWECECPEDLEKEIKLTKNKKTKKNERETKLALVEIKKIEEKPKEKDGFDIEDELLEKSDISN